MAVGYGVLACHDHLATRGAAIPHAMLTRERIAELQAEYFADDVSVPAAASG